MTAAKPKLGRPSSYKESYCDVIVSLMASGLSLTAAMAELDFHRDTAHEWAKHHPSFSDAMKRGQAKRTLFLERSMLSSTSGPEVTARIFALKNSAPDEWREKQQVELTGRDGGPIQHSSVDLSKLSEAALAELEAAALGKE